MAWYGMAWVNFSHGMGKFRHGMGKFWHGMAWPKYGLAWVNFGIAWHGVGKFFAYLGTGRGPIFAWHGMAWMPASTRASPI